VVLAGHRDTHFRFLRGLRAGDDILLESPEGRVSRYRIQSAEVVDHRDNRPLDAAFEPTLTLITCYPFDAIVPGGPLRYVVRAVEP
jgi:sortase A